jgi:hypothetical protein
MYNPFIRKFNFTIILLFSFLNIFSQNIIFTGYVENINTGERLAGASIVEMNSMKNVVSNNYGFFSINPNSDYNVYMISVYGYMSKTVVVLRSMKMPAIIGLTPNDAKKGIIATGSENEINMNSTINKINLKETKNLPSFLEQTNILNVAQLMPGINSGNDDKCNLYVRGGNFDENMLILDGVPIYAKSHLFGYISDLNSDAIRDFKIYKGSIPSNYGGSLSSATEIFMKDGDINEYHGEFNFNPVNLKYMIEGPILEGKSSFILSGQKSYLNLAMLPFGNFLDSINPNNSKFYNFNAKFTYRISDKNRVSISQYISNDNSQSNNNISNLNYNLSNYTILNSSNYLTVANWNYVISDIMFLNVIASYNSYNYGFSYLNKFEYKSIFQAIDSINASQTNSFYSKLNTKDYRIKIEITNYFGSHNQLNYGFSLSDKNIVEFNENKNTSTKSLPNDSIISNNNYSLIDAFVYIEDIFHLTSKIDINAGLHYSMFDAINKLYLTPEPRFSIIFRPNKNLTLNSSISNNVQNEHFIGNQGNFPELYISSSQNLKPSNVWQTDVGSNYLFENLIFGANCYYKTMKNIIELKDGTLYNNYKTNMQNNINIGQGLAYGFEFYLQKNEGNITGFISYTLSKSTRIFSNVNNGKSFPFDYDKTNQLNTNISYKILSGFYVNALWVFNSGIPYTMNYVGSESSSNSFPSTNYNEFLYTKNNLRMPYYHRLDISLNYSRDLSFGKGILRVGCYNVYNRKNIYAYKLTETKEPNLLINLPLSLQPAKIAVTKQYLLPILPFISYEIDF